MFACLSAPIIKTLTKTLINLIIFPESKMVITQSRAKKKITGGRLSTYKKKKRKYEIGRKAALTKIGDLKRKFIRMKGGSQKIRLLDINKANLFDSKTKAYSVVTIKSVVENKASSHFIRRNIMTKGAIIITEKGKAVITSRPGQDGVVNAVLISLT